jgi:hypothetical protein
MRMQIPPQLQAEILRSDSVFSGELIPLNWVQHSPYSITKVS